MEKQIENLEKRISFLECSLSNQIELNKKLIDILEQNREEICLLTRGLDIVNKLLNNLDN